MVSVDQNYTLTLAINVIVTLATPGKVDVYRASDPKSACSRI